MFADADVAGAAQWLDREAPGWEHKITRPLTNSFGGCVLGQVFGGYIRGMMLKGARDLPRRQQDAFVYVRRLVPQWKREIEARQKLTFPPVWTGKVKSESPVHA